MKPNKLNLNLNLKIIIRMADYSENLGRLVTTPSVDALKNTFARRGLIYLVPIHVSYVSHK